MTKSSPPVHVTWSVRVMTPDHHLVQGHATSISEKSVHLEMADALPAGLELLIEIQAQHEGQTHRLLGKGEAGDSIVLAQNKGYGMHLQFTTLDKDARDFLKSFTLQHDSSGKLNW